MTASSVHRSVYLFALMSFNSLGLPGGNMQKMQWSFIDLCSRHTVRENFNSPFSQNWLMRTRLCWSHQQGSTACSDLARAELLAAAGRRHMPTHIRHILPSAGSLLLSETLDLVRAGCRQA